ncbi:hypothetical protein AQUCO_07800005v1 [Aquilegia coerulea]|uniref:Uncharacterized protein n=1 Tax=Aquilegia coerulea TaxID=218851 RepID=A0A2G5C7Y9_AQUCA|nr:hypothetical protein AQUCO_07800005v1 [Aquilegia coerulea]
MFNIVSKNELYEPKHFRNIPGALRILQVDNVETNLKAKVVKACVDNSITDEKKAFFGGFLRCMWEYTYDAWQSYHLNNKPKETISTSTVRASAILRPQLHPVQHQ